MSEESKRIQVFVDYAKSLKGDEKGEAQVFLDRLFQAFGHEGYKEAGATLEERVRGKKKSVRFADLVWQPRLLLEMKSRGEKLQKHYDQARNYWFDLFPKPRFVVLCNFDEFWIYDFDVQHDPVDKIRLEDLSERYTAFNFLFPTEREPLFGNDRIAVTRSAADKVAHVFNTLVDQGEDRQLAQRFVLQCVMAMFAEDSDLLPRGFFTQLLNNCRKGASSYDLLGGLFRQMNDPSPARGGRYQKVQYFDGGLFQAIEPLELGAGELDSLFEAAQENWSKVHPEVFGTLFQHSMDEAHRHASGAHFTTEADIQKVVQPTIVRPWRKRIQQANTLKELRQLRTELVRFRVLDPACGSGNFLYVTYRELKQLEMELLAKVHANFTGRARARAGIDMTSLVSTKQMFGFDHNSFAVELAKVTLMLAKELVVEEMQDQIDSGQIDFAFEYDTALPLDNLDDNIQCTDALFAEWPQVDAVIGNPPFQSKNKMQEEYGRAYLNRVRAQYPDVPGRADYCVYWFRRTHDELPEGKRAGLVGTNTIRQNYSREGGLDYIVQNGGTITEAVSSQVWSGDAVVHVSIVNWVKGEEPGKKKLFTQKGDHRNSPFEVVEVDKINPALSEKTDVTQAKPLSVNKTSGACYQGQTHGHEGFLLTPSEASEMQRKAAQNAAVIFPYMTADEMLSHNPPSPQRFVIDFHPRDLFAATKYKEPFERVKTLVLPTREEAAEREKARNEEAREANPKARINRHHANFLSKWWLLSYARKEMIEKIDSLPRYIVCGRVTRRPIFVFVHSGISPNDALQVFTLSDDYSFGILQSSIHWAWFVERCSTLKRDFRYTSNTVFDSFPWPQSPKVEDVQRVAQAAAELRELRRRIMTEAEMNLRELYRTLEMPGKNPLKSAHEKLDKAVRAAYGMNAKQDLLAFLLKLNGTVAQREAVGKPVTSPGLPLVITNAKPFITADCVKMRP